MKAILISTPGDPDVLRIESIDSPSMSDEEIRVQVKATALNRADLLQRQGKYPAPPGVREDVPGLEFSGVVESVGDRVRLWKPGDRVMGLLPGGGYAEQVVTHERMALRIPEGMSFEEAAAIPEVFLTAFDAMYLQLQLQMGERLLIHAIGSGVGTAALQLACHSGAIVFGTSTSREKLDKAQLLGLHVAIHSPEEDFETVIREKTNENGVQAIFDMVGADYFDRNLSCLSTQGRMILVGLLSGRSTTANLGTILRKRLRILGTALRSRSLEEKISLTQSFRERILPLFEIGAIRPILDHVFPFEAVVDAHRTMESNRNFGKIVLSLEY